MARVSIEDCLKYVENRFALVSIASDRARRLMNGSSSLINTKNKEVVTALREIAEDLVVGAEPGANDEIEKDQTTFKKDFAVEDRFMDDDQEDKIEYSTTDDQNEEEDSADDDEEGEDQDFEEEEYVDDDGSDDNDGDGDDE